MKVIESVLGFKQKKTPVLQQRNSIVKLLLIINIPNLVILFLVNQRVPQPYMDQPFHFGQFLHYLRNDFGRWDDKITTPPGLYLIQRFICIFLPGSLAAIRGINVLIFSNILIVYVLKIYDFLQPCPNNLMRALNLAITPTIYFFNFLDYTDTLSLALIAAMYYYSVTKSEWRLGIACLFAVFVRQNNIVWILYLIIYRVLNDNKKLILAPKSLPSHILTIIKIFFNNKWQILKQSRFQILSIGIFVLYTQLYNQGKMVFGDHSHHRLTLHPNQLLYLSVFCVLNLPITLGQYLSSFSIFFQRIYISRHALAAFLFLLSLSIILVDKFTLIHPFIQDDNRHFTFYIYRYFLKHWTTKYTLCLVYAFCCQFIFKQTVNSPLKLMRFILWLGACFGYVCLTELVQFRYYGAPFLLLCLEMENKNFVLDVEGVHKTQSRLTNKQKMLWTTLIKVAFNACVLGLFLLWQFNNKYGKGRMMW